MEMLRSLSLSIFIDMPRKLVRRQAEPVLSKASLISPKGLDGEQLVKNVTFFSESFIWGAGSCARGGASPNGEALCGLASVWKDTLRSPSAMSLSSHPQ